MCETIPANGRLPKTLLIINAGWVILPSHGLRPTGLSLILERSRNQSSRKQEKIKSPRRCLLLHRSQLNRPISKMPIKLIKLLTSKARQNTRPVQNLQELYSKTDIIRLKAIIRVIKDKHRRRDEKTQNHQKYPINKNS